MVQQITEAEVRRIAELARLGLTDDEVVKAAADLQAILDNFSEIQAIDTTGVPVAADASHLQNVTREDIAAPEVLASHQALLDQAPERSGRQLKVPAVFKA